MNCNKINCSNDAKYYLVWYDKMERNSEFVCKNCLESINSKFIIDKFKLTICNDTQYRKEFCDLMKRFKKRVNEGASNKELQSEFPFAAQTVRNYRCKINKNK